MPKAIALYSGGLDSTLAVALMRRAGVEVIPLTFTSPFGGGSGEEGRMRAVADTFGLELQTVPFAEELIALVKSPRHGHGKNLNPCIDCHLLMLRKSKALLPAYGADFVVTGEVLGQRPMSQHRQALDLIARQSGLAELLLRPLSARLLPPTLPQVKGWVGEEWLLDIAGRGRTRQLELAKSLGLEKYQPPAGGCLLTDPGYTRKLRDVMDSGLLTEHAAEVIRHGRYFNLGPAAKLVVARQEAECRRLEALAQAEEWLLVPGDATRGPSGLLLGPEGESNLGAALEILAHYCRPAPAMEMEIGKPGGQRSLVRLPAEMAEERLRALLVG
ncbi:MAG: asparagine synthase-related protein [candidate division FCPU426 bacterium]